jgi:hypothetical protein
VVQFGAATFSVSEALTTANITLTRTGGTPAGESVRVTTFNVAATAGQDYTAVNQVVTFAAGQTSATVTVPILGDALVEGNETVFLALSDPGGGATLGSQASAVLTIVDNDVEPAGTIQFFGATFTTVEQPAGTANIMLSRIGGTAAGAMVRVTTSNGTAVAGQDYTAVDQVVFFNAGQVNATVTVPILDNTVSESAETVNLTLSDPGGGATLGAQSTAVLTIQGDNSPVTVEPAAFVNEAAGTVTVTVSRFTNLGSTGTVSYATADGTAVAGQDYVATSGTLTFAAGVASQTFTVALLNDALVEGNETFTVSLTAQSGELLRITGQLTQTVSLLDDDAPLTDQIGFAGSGAETLVFESLGPTTLTLVRSMPTDNTVSVTVATTGGTATPGVDYTPVNQVVTFAPGQTTAQVVLPIAADGVADTNESVTLALSNPTGGAALTFPTTAVVRISDSAPPTIQLSTLPFSANEADGTATVTINRTGVVSGAATVILTTSDGTATAGADYTAVSTVVTFAPGQGTVTVTIPVLDDGLLESAETVNLILSSPTNAVLGGQTTGVVTIVDNDAPGTILIDAAGAVGGGQRVSLDEDVGTATITLLRVGGSGGTVSVTFVTYDGSATAGADYTPVTRVVTFAPLQTSATVTIPVVNDALVEGAETINLALVNPTGGAAVAAQAAELLLRDGDGPVQGAFRFARPTYTITEGGATTLFAAVTRGGVNPVGAVSVTLTLSGGTAAAGTDYITTTRVLNFADGQGTLDLALPIFVDDALAEGAETVTLTLSNPTGGAAIGTASTAVLVIADNDVPPQGAIQFGAPRFLPNENGGAATVTLTRTGGSSGAVSVTLASGGGTATPGADYTAVNQVINFADGQTTATVAIPILDDTLLENSETFNLTLSAPTGGAILGVPFTVPVIIVDNLTPAAGAIQFDAATYSVGEGGGSATITLTRTGGSSGAVSVTVATGGGTATAGADYTAVSQVVNFAAGQTTATVTIPVTNDALFEGNETVNLAISAPTGGATLGAQATAVLTITDDDPAPTFSIDDVTVTEGNAGTVSAVFTVTLSGATALPATVQFATAAGTATSGVDFQPASGTLTFAPGVTTQTVTVAVVGDTAAEPNETFTVNLSGPTNATISDGQGQGTILNDDAAQPGAIQFLAAAASVGEGAGTAALVLTRTGGSDGAVSVTVTTSNGTATAGADYTAVTQVVTFAAGQTSALVMVPILEDALAEGPETVNLALSAPTGGATLGAPSTAVLTIVDNEAQPGTIQFGAATFTADENQLATVITLLRTGGADGAVSVTLTTGGGTATAGADYAPVNQVVTFGPGENTATVIVTLLDDQLLEGTETVNLALSNPTGGATLGGQSTAVLTILDDESPGVIQFAQSAYSAPESGGSVMVFLTRSSSLGTTSVTLTSSNGTATAGADYTAVSTAVTFADGQTFVSASVPVLQDALPEGNETFNLALSNPTSGATLGTSIAAVVTIQDDDIPGVIQFSAAAFSEFEIRSTAMVTLTRTGGFAAGEAVTVSTSNGTATAGADYTAVDQVVTFAAGQTTATVLVPLQNDALAEGPETVNLALTNPAGGATLGAQSTAVLTIQDDDTPAQGAIRFSAATYSVGEGGGSAVITLTRVGGISGAVSVTVATSNGTATAGADYTAVTQVVTFAAGQTTATVSVPILEDALVEGNETVNLALSAPTGGAVLGVQTTAVLTITDNDAAQPGVIQFESATYSVGEPDLSATVTLIRTGGSDGAVSVTVTTSNGTATAGADYTAVTQVVTFAAGQATATVSVPILDDLLLEGPETVNLALSAPTGGATLGSPTTAVLTIADDETAGEIRFGDPTYSVIEGGGAATIFLIRTSSAGTPSVTVTTSNGTATAGADYTAVSTVVTFAEGQTTASLTVSILQDALVEGPETVNLALSNPTSGATLGAPSTAVLTIQDDDTAGVVQFSAATYSVTERVGGTSTQVTLTRTGGAPGGESVTVTTSNGTATAGADYTVVSQVVTFAAGQTTATVTIPILDDAVFEGPETVNLTLSSPTGGATLGAQSTAVLTIQDDDPAPAGLTNGGFEVPDLAAGAFQYAPGGAEVGWAFSASAGVAANNSGFTAGNPGAPQGDQVGFLQNQASVTQTVGLAAGTYAVTFRAAQRGNFNPGGSQVVRVLVDGVVVGTFAPTGTDYQTFTTDAFTLASTGSREVRLESLTGGDSTALIDAVAVVAVPAPGPLANGGFELPDLAAGTFQYAPAGPGWAYSPSAGVAANGSGFTAGNPGAPAGDQVGFLQGLASVTQTLSLAAGSYRVEFRAAQRGNFNESQQVVRVSVGGVAVGTFTPAGAGYQAFATEAFTLAAAGTRLLVIEGLTGGDSTALVDAVAVAAVSAQVPLANAGFEVPIVGGSFGAFTYAPAGAGWAFSPSAGVSGNGSGFTAGNPPAPGGQQVGFLQGQASVSQVVALQPGTYALTFQAAQRGNFQPVGPQTIRARLAEVAGSAQTFTPTGPDYQGFGATFTVAAAGNYTLVLDTLVGGDSTALVDSVALAVL